MTVAFFIIIVRMYKTTICIIYTIITNLVLVIEFEEASVRYCHILMVMVMVIIVLSVCTFSKLRDISRLQFLFR